MAFNLKAATPDTSFPANGFLFGADSQAATDPSIYSHTAYLNYILGLNSTWTGVQTLTTPVLGAATGTSVTVSGLLQAGTTVGISTDVLLNRDAANSLALRNSTNAQAINIYNTYTDASNYERFQLIWSGNRIYLQQSIAGTGVARAMSLVAGGQLDFGSNFGTQWSVLTTGHLVAGADNTYDIGASGATRPRNIYVAGTGNISGVLTAASGTATPAGGSTAARVLFGTTSGFGIYYGSGAPSVSAAKGSIYLRSDGSGTGDRMYVNTDGATTWTAVTTAA